MRVTLLTNFLPPTQIGGTEVLSLNLAKSLQSEGIDIEVICADNWDSAPSHKIEEHCEVYEGVRVRRLHFNWRKAPDVFGSLYNNPVVAAYLRSYFGANRPDILHVLSCYSLSASPINVAADLGIPVVLTATDFWFLCARNTLLKSDGSLCNGPTSTWKCASCMLSDSGIFRVGQRILPESMLAPLFEPMGRIPLLARQRGLRGKHGDWADRFEFLASALRRTTTIVTASRLLERMYVESGVPQERITYSPYGIDASWSKEHGNKTPSAELRIGYIGQIDRHKGVDLLIRALSTLPRDAPIRLKIYGNLNRSPAFAAELQELASDDDRIAFCGTFPQHEIGHVLDGIDVLAVPSIWYDFPLVIYSAHACHTPVLATDLPGMNEMVSHDVDGLLFPRGDWGELARQLVRLLSEPALLPRLVDGISPVKSVDAMTDEYVALYTAVVTGSPPDVSSVQPKLTAH